MKIFPAIDLYDGKAVRLYKGDYDKMTVYSEDPLSVAKAFEAVVCPAGKKSRNQYLYSIRLSPHRAIRIYVQILS